MGEVIRYSQVFLATLCVIDIAYCVYLFRHHTTLITLSVLSLKRLL